MSQSHYGLTVWIRNMEFLTHQQEVVQPLASSSYRDETLNPYYNFSWKDQESSSWRCEQYHIICISERLDDISTYGFADEILREILTHLAKCFYGKFEVSKFQSRIKVLPWDGTRQNKIKEIVKRREACIFFTKIISSDLVYLLNWIFIKYFLFHSCHIKVCL